MNNGVDVVVSNIIEKVPSRDDYFGETKYYSPRFASKNHSSFKFGEGKYYSPRYANSETLHKSEVPPNNRCRSWEDGHVREAADQVSDSPEIGKEEEYYTSPPNSSMDDLILFNYSYLEENRKRFDGERYLVCNSCGGYYQLQDHEDPEDFSDECECGGQLEYRYSTD